MEKDPAMWSRTFARQLGGLLGFQAPEAEEKESPPQKKAAVLLEEMTEDFRYLPGQQWNWVDQLTRFLLDRSLSERQPENEYAGQSKNLETLRVVRSYVAFLRSCHGLEQPADESDEWTDEDLREFSDDTLRRLDETDPYEWSDLPNGVEEEK